MKSNSVDFTRKIQLHARKTPAKNMPVSTVDLVLKSHIWTCPKRFGPLQIRFGPIETQGIRNLILDEIDAAI